MEMSSNRLASRRQLAAAAMWVGRMLGPRGES